MVSADGEGDANRRPVQALMEAMRAIDIKEGPEIIGHQGGQSDIVSMLQWSSPKAVLLVLLSLQAGDVGSAGPIHIRSGFLVALVKGVLTLDGLLRKAPTCMRKMSSVCFRWQVPVIRCRM